MFKTLRVLRDLGVTYSTVIDLGCADGSFLLTAAAQGLIPGAVPFNVDANPLYRDSLNQIRDVLGGDYFIGAIADFEGEAQLGEAAHPYWSSLRPADDMYWQRINNLRTAKHMTVPTTSLDAAQKRFGLKPPFLLKLDIQGSELPAFKGGVSVLAETTVVIVEADIADFQDLNRFLVEHDFVLFNVTHPSYDRQGRLGWFYPIYVQRKISNVLPGRFWNSDHDESVIQGQVQRRESIVANNQLLLKLIRREPLEISRLSACPCGSGRRYKECHGALGLSEHERG